MKQKDIIFLLISTVIIVLAWIIFSIHHQVASSTISKTLKDDIAPISAQFDMESIDSLKNRQGVPVLDKRSFPTITPSPSIILSPTPSGSSSANITPTPTDTSPDPCLTDPELCQ